MKSINLPDGSGYLTDGTVVVLARFPKTKWIVHYGWYTYKCKQAMGWHFVSIPAQTTLPLSDSDLIGIEIVSGGSCPCPPDPHPPHPPRPPRPEGPEYTEEKDDHLARAFISVETIFERDALEAEGDIPDGKIVRVDECPDGESRYFIWRRAKGEWEEEQFGSADPGYSKEYIDKTFIKKEEAKDIISQEVASLNIDDKVQSAVDSVDIPGQVSEAIKSDTQIRTVVESVSREIVPEIVTEEVSQIIDNASWKPISQNE